MSQTGATQRRGEDTIRPFQANFPAALIGSSVQASRHRLGLTVARAESRGKPNDFLSGCGGR
jgi:hypothetical protein